MKRAVAFPIAVTLVLASASGAYAAARHFYRSDADAQVSANPRATCLGKTPTIYSTSSVVMGTSGNDVIVSTRADAEVYGLDGNDTICVYNTGGSAYGGRGRDVIWVDGNQFHTVVGGPGSDVILSSNISVPGLGDGGDSFLIGGEGDDVVYGGGGDEVIGGQAGNDHLYGGHGEDWLWGGLGGNDVVKGKHSFDN